MVNFMYGIVNIYDKMKMMMMMIMIIIIIIISSNFPVSNIETCNYIRHRTFNSEIYLYFTGHKPGHRIETSVSVPTIVGGRNASPRELPFQVSQKNDMVLLQ
jgi:hypothetical protein